MRLVCCDAARLDGSLQDQKSRLREVSEIDELVIHMAPAHNILRCMSH